MEIIDKLMESGGSSVTALIVAFLIIKEVLAFVRARNGKAPFSVSSGDALMGELRELRRELAGLRLSIARGRCPYTAQYTFQSPVDDDPALD